MSAPPTRDARARAIPKHRQLLDHLYSSHPDPVSALATSARQFLVAVEVREVLLAGNVHVRRHYQNFKGDHLARFPDNPLAVAEIDVRIARAHYLAAAEYACLRGVTFATPDELDNARVFEEP